jgi:hypothetical protein
VRDGLLADPLELVQPLARALEIAHHQPVVAGEVGEHGVVLDQARGVQRQRGGTVGHHALQAGGELAHDGGLPGQLLVGPREERGRDRPQSLLVELVARVVQRLYVLGTGGHRGHERCELVPRERARDLGEQGEGLAEGAGLVEQRGGPGQRG